MATANIAINTELALVTTLTQSLTLNLPNNSPTGKSLFIKDATGNSLVSTITIQTQGSDTFEDGSVKQILNQSFGSYQLTYNPTKWYITGGTFYNSMNITSVTTQKLISTTTISTSYITLSSLSLVNQFASTNTFNSISSLLYYNNNLMGGGFREAVPQIMNRFFIFSPKSLANLLLWFDASDYTTITTSGAYVTAWNDKSGNNNYAVVKRPNGTKWSANTINFFSNYASMGGTLTTPIPSGTLQATFFAVAITTTPSYYNTSGRNTLFYLNDGSSIDSNSPYGMVFAATCNNYPVNTSYANFTATRTVSISPQNLIPAGTAIITTTTIDSVGNIIASLNGNYPYGTSPYYDSNRNNNITNKLTGFGIGDELASINNQWLGGVNEIILYNSYLPLNQQQQVEGYLAWKWKLQSNLPTSHPYRYVSP